MKSNSMKITTISLLVFLLATTATAQRPERFVRAEILVKSDINSVWKAWTTEAGVKSFFAPACSIEAKTGGQYEIYFCSRQAETNHAEDHARDALSVRMGQW